MTYSENDSFCALLWTHRVVDMDGKLKECCRAAKGHGHVSEWEVTWNDERTRSIRRDMVAGIKNPDLCRLCYFEEANGRQSMRQKWNRFFDRDPAFYDLVSRSIQKDYHVDEDPVYLELRFGSLCNLQCKMCAGNHSTMIRKDAADLKLRDPTGYQSFFSWEDRYIDVSDDWFLDPATIAKLDALIPNLIEVNYSGGEPTLVKAYLMFLKRCIELDRAKDMNITLVTNLTNINDDLVADLQKFKSCCIVMSIDAIGDCYEYIRVPAKWAKIRQNYIKIMALAKAENFFLEINMVAQVFNMLYLGEALDEFIRLHAEYGNPNGDRLSITVSSILHPDMFRMDKAPDDIRELALARFMTWFEQSYLPSPRYRKIMNRGTIDMVFSQLHGHVSERTSRKRLRDYVAFVDQNKKQKLGLLIPELQAMLSSESNDEQS